jgi:CHAT domain-containing protein/tetratricopeptide (TPR) repeat protein
MRGFFKNRFVPATLAVGLLVAVGGMSVSAQSPSGVSPPRTIADIARLLDNERPDAAAIAKLRSAADAKELDSSDRVKRARFFYDRSQARMLLGEFKSALSDAMQAVEIGRQAASAFELTRYMQGVALQYAYMGDPKKSLEGWQALLHQFDLPGTPKGLVFNTYRHIVELYIQIGDLNQAEVYFRKAESTMDELRGSPNYRGYFRFAPEAEVKTGEAALDEAHGRYSDAEVAYARAHELRLESIALRDTFPAPPPKAQLQYSADDLLASLGRAKARQGRMAEGEIDVRRALLNRLETTGKYQVQTAKFLGYLANLLIEQGRYAEAEQLTRNQIDIFSSLGVAKDAQFVATALSQLASVLTLQGRWDAAIATYKQLDAAVRDWDATRRDAVSLNTGHIAALYKSGDMTGGIDAAERFLALQNVRFGDQHFQTALARGMLASGLSLTQHKLEALREFVRAVPVLLASRQKPDSDDAFGTATRDRQIDDIVAFYIGLIADSNASIAERADQTFALGEAIRGHAVERALAQSSARAAARDATLAEIARKSQDIEKQLGAQLDLMNGLLAIPSSERDEKATAQLNETIARLRVEQKSVHLTLAAQFPGYANLVNPKPPSIGDIRTILRPDEAFIAFYFGRDDSFVWALSKSGPVGFAAIHIGARDIESKVHRLRQALEPEAAMIGDIPPFDVGLAYELFGELLKPVEAGWKSATSLIVVTNGALGFLPLAVLPTAPSHLTEGNGPLFAGYRDIPWLSRNYAVTMVPSASALMTLRHLPPAPIDREELIGFGDPLFSAEQAADAAKAETGIKVADAGMATTRGFLLKRRSSPQLEGIDSADLAMLPRLPDTTDELRSIALTLHADPTKVLHLGKDANEQVVKTMDLSGFKVLAFATHGLVPGELDGLTQPALALSAPAVAGVEGDGLLTMEEILALKLDADWVVLSACNTGAGSGAGAEAVSGLGRAFFYAGTRALLVTNWSVHSQSARELVTDLFRRQALDPKLTRGEALRQAMMALADGPGYIGADGKTEFTYAHPLFWAPYSIIGDGGAR